MSYNKTYLEYSKYIQIHPNIHVWWSPKMRFLNHFHYSGDVLIIWPHLWKHCICEDWRWWWRIESGWSTLGLLLVSGHIVHEMMVGGSIACKRNGFREIKVSWSLYYSMPTLGIGIVEWFGWSISTNMTPILRTPLTPQPKMEYKRNILNVSSCPIGTLKLKVEISNFSLL